MTFAVTSNDPFTMVGRIHPDGQLFPMPNAAYTLAGKTMTATVTEIKVTSQGIEGTWTAQRRRSIPGLRRNGYLLVALSSG